MTPPKLLGIPEVCAALDAAPSTLRKWRAEGQIAPPDVTEGGRVFWHESTVAKMSKPDPSRNRRPRPPATHCIRGHPLSGSNLRVSGGKRACGICQDDAKRRWRKRQVALCQVCAHTKAEHAGPDGECDCCRCESFLPEPEVL